MANKEPAGSEDVVVTEGGILPSEELPVGQTLYLTSGEPVIAFVGEPPCVPETAPIPPAVPPLTTPLVPAVPDHRPNEEDEIVRGDSAGDPPEPASSPAPAGKNSVAEEDLTPPAVVALLSNWAFSLKLADSKEVLEAVAAQ